MRHYLSLYVSYYFSNNTTIMFQTIKIAPREVKYILFYVAAGRPNVCVVNIKQKLYMYK